MRRLRAVNSLWLGLIGVCALTAHGSDRPGTVRITTWNLQWFPNGSQKEATPEEQRRRINEAANVLRPLNPDILLLQEVRDYEACVRLGNAVRPAAYQVAICSAFKGGPGSQQVAILAKWPAQAAWSEQWKSMDGVDPPRGFAFSWFKIGKSDIGIYSLHLKSNLVRHGIRDVETAKNIRKREVAIEQLLTHVEEVIGLRLPVIKSIVIGGDFNTNQDQEMFANENTLRSVSNAGYLCGFETLPLNERITHPGNHGYPDATFDYLFSKCAHPKPIITRTSASDHFPVTLDIVLP